MGSSFGRDIVPLAQDVQVLLGEGFEFRLLGCARFAGVFVGLQETRDLELLASQDVGRGHEQLDLNDSQKKA